MVLGLYAIRSKHLRLTGVVCSGVEAVDIYRQHAHVKRLARLHHGRSKDAKTVSFLRAHHVHCGERSNLAVLPAAVRIHPDTKDGRLSEFLRL